MRATADILTHSLPNILAKRLQIRTTAKMLDRDNPLLQRLRGAGFALDSGPDGSGICIKYLSHGVV